MQMCTRCGAAVEAGRTHCPICELPVVGGAADLTRVDGGPPTPVAGSPVGMGPPPPALGPPPGFVPPPAYGGYGAPAGYGPAPGYGAPAGYGAAPLPALRSKAVAALLCFFLGSFGVHRFYTGQVGLGLALLLTTLILGTLTCGIWLIVTFVWVMVDFVLILTGGVDDQWGRPLT